MKQGKKAIGKLTKAWLLVGGVMGLAMSMTGTASADAIDDIIARGELIVAAQTQGPPVSFVNKNGERVGFVVDIVKAIADDMGVKLKIIDYDWKGLIPAVVADKADFVAADMAPKPSRALVLTFTDAFYDSPTVMYTKKDSPYSHFKDLNKEGVTVGVVAGSSNKQLLEKHLPKATIKEFSGGGAALAKAVDTDRVVAVINDISAAKANMAKYSDTFKILDGALYVWPEAFGVRPEKTHLIAWLNNWIAWAKRDGKIQMWADYWRLSPAWQADHQ